MKILKKFFLTIIFISFWTSLPEAIAHQDIQVDSYTSNIILQKNHTYTNTFETIHTALTPIGVSNLQTWSMEFFPECQNLEIIEAYVIHKDGTKIFVTPENIFIRPTSTTEQAPPFNNSHKLSVVFPQLRVGSRIYLTAKLTQKDPDPLGFSEIFYSPFSTGIKNLQINVTLPKSLKLEWRERGGFKVEDKVADNTRIIQAHLENVPGNITQNSMENPMEFVPIFILSTLQSWEEIGKKLYTATKDNLILSDQIKELSNDIVQEKKGREAIKAIYNWVTENIYTVKSLITPYTAFKTHSLEKILKNRIGDNKDKVILMCALLHAQGISSFPALVSSLYKPFPLPTLLQFDQMIIYFPTLDTFANPGNPFASFGILGESLEGKFTVIGTSEGKEAYLPFSTAATNTYEDVNLIEILPNGTIEGSNSIHCTGNLNSWLRRGFAENSTVDVAQNLLDQTRQAGYGNFRISGNPYDLSRPFKVEGTWTTPNFLSFKDWIFLWVPVGLDGKNSKIFHKDITAQQRLYPYIASPAQLTWSYEIKIPEGYTLSNLPKNTHVENQAGSYESTYVQEKNVISIKRIYTLNKPYFTAQEYENLLRPLLYTLETETHAVLAFQKKK